MLSPATAVIGRVNEPARTTSPAFSCSSCDGDLVREPGNAGRRMVEHAGGEAGFLDHAVLEQHRAGPAKIDRVRADRATAEDDPGVGGEVRDRVEDLAHCLVVAVELLDPGIDDLERRADVLGRGEDVEHADAGPAQRLAEDEGELDLDPRRDEARDRNVAALGEEHVVHQRRVVGLADLARLLHRARGQADLASLDAAAVGLLEPHPLALDRVAVVDRHLRDGGARSGAPGPGSCAPRRARARAP